MSNATTLSVKEIPSRERLIVALDVPSPAQAKALVERLGDSVWFYKVGLELFMAGQYHELVQWLLEKGKKVFVDLKFFDIPQTVGAAVARLQDLGAHFATVHGNDDILRYAVKNKGSVKILAVTVLTSLDRNDLRDLGFQCDIESLVASRARRAFDLGCDGVISSGLEAEKLRTALGDKFLIITPGIRAFSNSAVSDDQKRTVDVEEAFRRGADYVVMGRPIRAADDPRQAALDVQKRIASVFQA